MVTISLKSLDYNERFTQLCNQIVLAEFPDAKPIEGKGGDLGIDAFIGEIDGKLVIFQYKYFTDKIGDAQKRQTKKSLDSAAKLNPDKWILLVALDFNVSAQKWFDRLKEEYPTIKEMDYWSGSKLISLILKHPHIKEEFFPDTALLLRRMERLLAERADYPKNPSLALLDQAKELRDLINLDNPYYRYELHTDEDKTMVTVHPKQLGENVPAPTFNMKLNFPKNPAGKKAAKEFEDFIKKGTPATIAGEYIESVTSDIDMFPFQQPTKFAEIKVGPAASDETIPVRLDTVSADGEKRSIDYVALKRVRVGTEELELANRGQNIPLEISMVLNLPTRVLNIRFTIRHAGFYPSQILKCEQFFRSVIESRMLEVTHLETGLSLGKSNISKDVSFDLDESTARINLLEALIKIENSTGVRLILPEEITDDDIETIGQLERIIDTGKDTQAISSFSFGLAAKDAKDLLQNITSEDIEGFMASFEESSLELFGTIISLGKCSILVPEVKLLQPLEEIRQSIERANPGDTITINIEPKDHRVTFDYENWRKKDNL